MPKDKRLYMTFPIDFDEHPKVAPLSDAAFRAFFEMNGYCRRQRTDGRILAVVARKKWKPRALAELIATDATKPLVVLEGDTYVLLSYADHQFTTTDEEELHVKRSQAGRSGGEAKAKALALARQTPQQNVARSESGLEIHLQTLNQSSTERNAGVDMTKIIAAVQRFCGRDCTLVEAYRIVGTVMDRSKAEVKHPTAYVMKAVQDEPFVFQKMLDEAESEAADRVVAS